MTSRDIPNDVIALVHGPVASIAHLEVLLSLRDEALAVDIDEIAAGARIASAQGARAILTDLETAGLVVAIGDDRWRYAPRGAALRLSVDALAAMYNERPVTLVRLLYERPARTP